jgi:surface protein
MEAVMDVEWPVEMLGRILHFLAMDGASYTWQHLAYLTHKNASLKRIAEKMQRPMVFRIGFDGDAEETKFIIPFCAASVVQIEIDWGDDTPIQIFDLTIDHEWRVDHEYKNAQGREFVVQVFPHGDAANNVWLDHLGWGDGGAWSSKDLEKSWPGPLRSFTSLGSLGISSLEGLFLSAEHFNLPLSTLDVSGVKNMCAMFSGARSFNQPIGSWNVSNVTDMSFMFNFTDKFNQAIGGWNVGCVNTMRGMFGFAQVFNQPIGDWDVSQVDDMCDMFVDAPVFNQDISRWNVSNVSSMMSMFSRAVAFNQPLEAWDVSNVVYMGGLFQGARSFNQSIGGWDVSSVVSMFLMFNETIFNQDIGNWNVSSVEEVENMFLDCPMDISVVERWNLPPKMFKSLRKGWW